MLEVLKEGKENSILGSVSLQSMVVVHLATYLGTYARSSTCILVRGFRILGMCAAHLTSRLQNKHWWYIITNESGCPNLSLKRFYILNNSLV